jgi:hypothetical protein
MHPWPYRDVAGLGIVEGGLRWGAPIIVIVVVGAIVLIFLLPLQLLLPLAFTSLLGLGQEGEGPP